MWSRRDVSLSKWTSDSNSRLKITKMKFSRNVLSFRNDDEQSWHRRRVKQLVVPLWCVDDQRLQELPIGVQVLKTAIEHDNLIANQSVKPTSSLPLARLRVVRSLKCAAYNQRCLRVHPSAINLSHGFVSLSAQYCPCIVSRIDKALPPPSVGRSVRSFVVANAAIGDASCYCGPKINSGIDLCRLHDHAA